MNERIMEIFARNIVASLPRRKKRIYQFIESVEDMLAQQSETREQFLNLLKDQSPYHQAASRFNMTIGETVRIMHEIEDEITKKLELKIKNYKWIDYTNRVNKFCTKTNNNKQYFLIIS
ncbi:hypothetical protein QFZ28_000138 [Neobacillus niacini]|uniref:hypothetical protein n=1 Tax=Neobacillus niacini TaxID=86668 RepID=UPI0027886BAE|nr:hypothetical protein [Neobacillus niacini]MDQ0999738.1 hypothetical protein [Neobacillus niacini]